MSDLCTECRGKCCVGEIDVYHEDEIFFDTTLVERCGTFGKRVMKVDSNNNCIALKDGRCTIYAKRPKICQVFAIGSKCCEEFRTGKKTKHSCSSCPTSKQVQKYLRSIIGSDERYE